MPHKYQNVTGFSGVDTTTDPYILGKKDPSKATMGYNLRAKNNIRRGRFGYEPVVQGTAFKKSGIYFPYGSHAHLPATFEHYSDSTGTAHDDTWYCASATDFTIEWWMKGSYESFDREICWAPCSIYEDSTTTRINHMNLTLVPNSTTAGETNLKLRFAADEDGGGTWKEAEYLWDEVMPLDNEWHHYAIVRLGGSPSSVVLYIDAGSGEYEYDTATHDITGDLPTETKFQWSNDEPLFWNHLWIGDSNLHMAEFRIWNDERTETEIQTNYDKALTGNEPGLVCYVPFDEGDGKYFTERVHSARGYFHPQEPWVNDDNELVFSGYQSLAFPSVRANYKVPDGYSRYGYDSTHEYGNMDSSYDKALLFDVGVNGNDTSESIEDNASIGVWKGISQIRFKLRQLKEGVIAGRLCLRYWGTSGYRLLFYTGEGAVGGSNWIWQDAARYADTGYVVDESWIGTAKTVTIYYDGYHNLPHCYIYVDDTQVDASTWWESGGDLPTWSSGQYMGDSNYEPFLNTNINASSTRENDLDGAIGGSANYTEMGIAFDLVFFRQWAGEPFYFAEGVSNLDDFVADTYDVAELPDSYRYFAKGISGYLTHGQNYATFNTSSLFPFTSGSFNGLQMLSMPFHTGSDGFGMSGDDTFFYIDDTGSGNTDKIPKQDVLLRMGLKWSTNALELYRDIDDTDRNIYLHDGMGTKRWFSGGVLSQLVNEYNFKTFRDNQLDRHVYYNTTNDIGDSEIEEENLPLFSTITDDSPLQGVETIGGKVFDSKFLILATGFGANSSFRDTTIHKQKSFKARWCVGPLSYETDEAVVIRGIFRYTSEKGDVNKLLAVANTGVFEIDVDTGTATDIDWGWIDKNSNAMVNHAILNNKLVIMDSKNAIKMNFRGDMSRLGVERPMQVIFETCETQSFDYFGGGEQYAYTAQFYDSVNDVYSGAIPIYSDYNQQLLIVPDTTDTEGVDHFEMSVRGCKDYNVDRVRIYRTADLGDNGTGNVGILYLVKDMRVAKLDQKTKFRDLWIDSEMTATQPILPLAYFGDDNVPSPSDTMGIAYNRLWTFGTDDAKATARWSSVDSLGFGKPDEMPTINSLIVEEGGTTEGKAVLEYNGQLYAFKEDSIFRIQQYSPGAFASDLLYKGVGALNQRCVKIAGDSIMFLDKTGLYTYRGGEPRMVSVELMDFFKNSVSSTNVGNSFILHNKKEEQILCFVPGENSTYPDRCVVYDMRTGLFTIDLVPECTCGYVDANIVYLGTPYGKILKYSQDAYVDVLDSALTPFAATVTGTTIDQGDSGNFPNDGTTMGARVFIYDTNWDIWTGTINTETSTTVVGVRDWEPLFSTSSSSPSGSMTVLLGNIYFHDETPIYSFFDDVRDKVLHEFTVTSNRVGSGTVLFFYEVDLNDAEAADLITSYKVLSGYENTLSCDFGGAHKNYSITCAGFYTGEFKWRNTAHKFTYTRGLKDA